MIGPNHPDGKAAVLPEIPEGWPPDPSDLEHISGILDRVIARLADGETWPERNPYNAYD